MLTLRSATRNDIDALMAMVADYHAFEHVATDREKLSLCLSRLMDCANDFGRVYLIQLDETIIGYLIACFGFSLEFYGRDAFLDEMFIVESQRGKHYGRQALALLRAKLSGLGIQALHLEVAKTNQRAQSLYQSMGFNKRDKYFLMTNVIAKV